MQLKHETQNQSTPPSSPSPRPVALFYHLLHISITNLLVKQKSIKFSDWLEGRALLKHPQVWRWKRSRSPWPVSWACPAPARCHDDGRWPYRDVSDRTWCGGPGSRRTLDWEPCWRGQAACGLRQSRTATTWLGQTSTPRLHPPTETHQKTERLYLKINRADKKLRLVSCVKA